MLIISIKSGLINLPNVKEFSVFSNNNSDITVVLLLIKLTHVICAGPSKVVFSLYTFWGPFKNIFLPHNDLGILPVIITLSANGDNIEKYRNTRVFIKLIIIDTI